VSHLRDLKKRKLLRDSLVIKFDWWFFIVKWLFLKPWELTPSSDVTSIRGGLKKKVNQHIVSVKPWKQK
jgi:hypothetical protein